MGFHSLDVADSSRALKPGGLSPLKLARPGAPKSGGFSGPKSGGSSPVFWEVLPLLAAVLGCRCKSISEHSVCSETVMKAVPKLSDTTTAVISELYVRSEKSMEVTLKLSLCPATDVIPELSVDSEVSTEVSLNSLFAQYGHRGYP